MWTANAVGFFLGCFYFLEFARFAPKRSRTLPGSVVQHFHFCFAVIFGTLILAVVNPSGAIIGQFADLFYIAMLASPLAALPIVMETKSAKAIQLPYTLAVLANSILWTVVGFEWHESPIYIPTILGLLLGLVQIGLKIKYGDGPNDVIFVEVERGEAIV